MPSTPDHRITIRLKGEEYALLTAKAGDKPLGAFVRDMALQEAARKRSPAKSAPIKDHAALAQILALLGQSNRVATFKRISAQVDDGIEAADAETKELLREIRDVLTRILNLLMHALGVAER